MIENGLNCCALSVGGSQAIEVKLTDKIQLSQSLLIAVVVKGFTSGKLRGVRN